MLHKIAKLSQYQKQALASQVESYDEGQVSVLWNKDYGQHEIHSQESAYVGYKCECGALIADYEDYTGRDVDVDRCHKCGQHYDYTEDELATL